MKYPKGAPSWVREAAESQITFTVSAEDAIGDRLTEIAQKLVASASLVPLWGAIEKQANRDAFWLDFFDGGPADYFKHLVRIVYGEMEPPSGYAAMSPGKLFEWRKRTHGHALKLLGDLMDGYPQIAEKGDDAYLQGAWVMSVAMHLGTNGEETRLGKLIGLLSDEKINNKAFAGGYAVASRLPMILTYLIEWLESEAGKNHNVTHAASKNVHRNSFIRSMTEHFEQFFDTPMRKHVFGITELFFEMDGLTANDIKKIAPANRGKIFAKSPENPPG